MRRVLTFLCFAALLTPPTLPAGDPPPDTGEEQSFQELTIHEFAKLERADQVEYLKQAVLRFREKTRNISATTVSRADNVPCDPLTGIITKRVDLLKSGSIAHHEMRRIGDSFRIWLHHDPYPSSPNQPRSEVVQAYNSESGKLRHLQSRPNLTQPTVHEAWIFGADDASHNVADGHFFYQFLGDDREYGEAWWDLGGDFLDHADQVVFVSLNEENQTVQVTYPTSWTSSDKSKVIAILTFDLSKGCLPVEETATEYIKAGNSKSIKYRHHVVLSTPVQVDGIWFPTSFHLEAWMTKHPQEITLYQATASNIQVGKLEPQDLQLTFPEGTKVKDTVNGREYHIGENGSQIPIIPSPQPASSGVAP